MAVQVAIAVVLMSGTALLGRSMLEALRVDLGFDARGLALALVAAWLPARRAGRVDPGSVLMAD